LPAANLPPSPPSTVALSSEKPLKTFRSLSSCPSALSHCNPAPPPHASGGWLHHGGKRHCALLDRGALSGTEPDEKGVGIGIQLDERQPKDYTL